MNARSLLPFLCCSFITLIPQIAAADDSPPSAPPVSSDPQPASTPPVVPVTQHASSTDSVNEHGGEVARVPWTGRVGHGVGLGIGNGLWGANFVQEVRFRFPIVEFFGITVKGLMLHDNGFPEYHLDGGGRLELWGGTPIIAGFARLYGGGGLHAMTKIGGPGNKDLHIGGGGHFGFEFFLNPTMSWVLEVGGGSGVDDRATGGTVVGGMHFYPWTK